MTMPEVIGHRGARTLANHARMAPENTLPALQQAAHMGASLEFDVIATADGHVVIHHDDETGRLYTLPGGDKFVYQSTLPELRAARFNTAGHQQTVEKMLGSNQPYTFNADYAQTPIPELTDALDQLPADTRMYIELKTFNNWVTQGTNNQLEERVVKLVQDRNLYDRVTLISFSTESLKRIHQLDPRIQTGLDKKMSESFFRKSPMLTRLFVGWAKRMLGVSVILPDYAGTTQALVKAAHKRGLRVAPWVDGHQTRDDEIAFFPKLLAMGVDGICTNAVDALQTTLASTRP